MTQFFHLSMKTNCAVSSVKRKLHFLCGLTAYVHLHKTFGTFFQIPIPLNLSSCFWEVCYTRQVTCPMPQYPSPPRRNAETAHCCAEVISAELTGWKKMPGSNHGLFIPVWTAGTAPTTPAPTTGTNTSWWTSTIWARIRTKLLQTLLFGPLIKAF